MMMLYFATQAYEYFRDDLLGQVDGQLGVLERKTFDDGELYHRIACDVAGRDVALVGGTICDGNAMELFDLACGLVLEGARSLTIVAPYFGYATMDRAVKQGEIVKAKTRAKLLSSIPQAQEANRLLVLDLHAEGVQYYFEGGMHAVHVYGKPVVPDAIRSLGGSSFVLACTDAGRAKWVESLANELNVQASFVFKKRLANGAPVVTAMNADVDGQVVVIYDDMIRSGRSLLNAAEAYRSAGAADVCCVTTHGIFAGNALAEIRATQLISKIIATNSHPRAVALRQEHPGFLEVHSAASAFAAALQSRTQDTP
jgi:ribose-phosphate pyrophosphokinase